MFSNGAHNSSALSLHDFAVGQQNEIWIALMIVNFFIINITVLKIISEILRLLFLDVSPVLSVNALINFQVHFVKDDAISWHPVSLANLNNISNDNIPDGN